MPELNKKITGLCSANRILSIFILLTLLLMFSVDVNAQPGGLDDDPGSSVPVDGGLSALLGAGIVYGTLRFKSRDRRKGSKVKDRPVT